MSETLSIEIAFWGGKDFSLEGIEVRRKVRKKDLPERVHARICTSTLGAGYSRACLEVAMGSFQDLKLRSQFSPGTTSHCEPICAKSQTRLRFQLRLEQQLFWHAGLCPIVQGPTLRGRGTALTLRHLHQHGRRS